MSRIGNAPVTIPQGVTVTSDGAHVVVKGSRGELRHEIPSVLSVSTEGQTITVTRKNESKKTRAMHGYFRSIIANAIVGVNSGWTRVLELSGVGYRANMSGPNLVLSLGFSHTVTVEPPPGITLSVGEGAVVVSGINNQEVGAAAAKIREIKKPEPYKGKGIRYRGEYVRKKAGKAKAVGGAPGAGGK